MNKFDLLSKLISFDTTSRNSNLELIDYVQNYLLQYGIQSTLTYNPNKTKANLFATLPTATGQKTGGLILSGHTDVVPVDGQNWDTNPFVATKIDDKIFGRGSCDMKGFLAVVLSLVPEISALKLTRPIHLAFSYDEEVGCNGASLLIADAIARGINPTSCIVGEPSSMKPVIENKGISLFRCRVIGKAAHSSLTSTGCNAIDYAAECICKIRELANEVMHGKQEENYDVPFSSISTNLINGGNAINTIAGSCEFIFDIRNLPQVEPKSIVQPLLDFIEKDLLPRMRREYAAASVEITTMASVPGFIANKSAEITTLIINLMKQNDELKVGYVTEAGLFQNNNIDTIICGPGDIQQAHGTNEFVTVEQINLCEQFIRDVAHNLTL